MTAQPYVTAEHPSLDSPLESPLSAAAWRPIPERSAHEWIDRTARNLLPRPGTVVALDHGTGHWITSLMPLGHEVLAADSSQERLNTLAQRAGYALSHDPRAAFRQFAAGAGGPQAVLVHAELDALRDRIQSSGLKADAVCVNAIGASFPSPEIIFDTCMPWLKDGGLPGSGIMEMARRASEFPHVLTEEVEALVNASHICQFSDIMFSELVILVAGLCWSCA